MKTTKRILALLLTLCMILGVVSPVFAEEVQTPTLAAEDEVIIYYTNDVHTYIDKDLSYDNLADLKTATAEQAAGVLLVDAGDAVQGTAYGSMDKGKTIIGLMNAAGYDLATLGNHEFDYGMDGCMNVIEWAEFPYVSANFYHEKDGVVGETVLDAYKVFEVGGKKIAIIGVTTPESFTKSTPAYFQDENGNYIYGIGGGTDGEALYSMVQAAIDAASAEADLVIGLVHLGDDQSSQPWTSEEMIANTTGLDAVIDGHSHSTVAMKEVADEAGNPVILTQTGEYFGAIGKMTITAEGEISTELVTEWAGSDAAVKAIKDEWMTEIDTQLGQIIGTAEVTLDNYDAEGERLVRTQETNTGDFCADALYYLFDNMGLDVDFAIMNGGGVRNKAITGEMSYKTCKDIHTFGNVACLQTITGQQIVDALEWGARQAPDVQVGGFLHVSGLKYTIDASVVSSVQADDKGVWTGAPTGEYRVKDVQVYNKETGAYEPIDLAAKYNLAGYNYTLRDLGDGFAMFDGAVNVLDYVMEDYMVLANYVKAFENATVQGTNSPLNAKYENFGSDYSTTAGSGRITILAAEQEWDGKVTIGGLDNNLWMTKYGNVYTDCAAENFTEDLGLAWADLVTVKFLDQELVLPVVPTYSYVDSGKPAVILGANENGNPTGYVSLAINMGNFAETYGIAQKMTDEGGNWYWVAFDGVEFPIEVSYELYEKEGYMAEYLLHELSRTNNREDYADLTDAQFANFRAVATTGMGSNLYRSSSPINPEIGRNTYAMTAAEAAGITVIMNLADTADEAALYEGFEGSYYADQKVIYLGLGVDFAEESFKTGLAKGLKFFAENEGTYLVHCNEGKDRAGFVNALLECLMGATAEEVVADYMVTYYNYYGIEAGTDKYAAIANSNIIKSLQTAFGVDDIYAADLAAEAAAYIAEIGLSEDEITALKANLAPASSDVVVYYTNDVHTYIDGEISYDNLAWLKYNTDAAQVLLVDAGDAIQGTAYGSMDKGETIIKLMNAAGYDLATLGNHEFDYGMDGAMNAIDWADFPYVSANFYHEKDGVAGDTVLDAYHVFETANGLKIAFVGITTPESFTKSTPAYFQDENGNYIYGIAGGTDGAALYAAVQSAIDAATAEADIVIALGHLGDDPASKPWTSEEVIANTTGLDAFIDGHSHSTVAGKQVKDKAGNDVLLTQTGEYFGAIGKMTITAEGEISTELVTAVEGTSEEVKAVKDAWMTEIDTKLGEVIGKLDVTLDNYDAEGGRLVRKQETNTGAFAADALYYLFDNMGLDVDVAIMNGGGVRNKAVTGEFSYKTAKEIHTFGNVACLQTITGQQLLDALEWGAKSTPDAENGGFLHVSGITYEIDTSIASTVQKDDKGVWTGGPTGEYRVKNVKILQDGEYVDLDLNAKYNLAGYNYTLRDLGDGFAMFDGAVNVLDYVMEDYMVLANYIKSFPVDETTGLPTVTAENSPYGDIDYVGRITLSAGHSHDKESLEYHEAVEASCHQTGMKAYYYCAECDAFFDADLVQTNSKRLVVLNTAEIEHVEAAAATCHDQGNLEYWYCTECDAVFTDAALTQISNRKSVTVAALGSENVEHYEAVAATCHDRGNVEYWYCADCDRYFLDEAGTLLTNALSIYLPELGSEKVKHVEAVASTCEVEGNVEYWYCEDCDRYFLDEAGTLLTNALSVKLPKIEECSCDTFSDIKAEMWYHDAVDYVANAGIMNGMPDGTFAPDGATTRAQLAVMLWRLAGAPTGNAETTFKDLDPKAEWYQEAIKWAFANGIINGRDEETFDPDANVTRQEMVTMFYRFAKLMKVDLSAKGDLAKFEDGKDVAEWANEAMTWAIGSGLVNGNSINGVVTLDLNSNATRAMMATVMMRYNEEIAK